MRPVIAKLNISTLLLFQLSPKNHWHKSYTRISNAFFYKDKMNFGILDRYSISSSGIVTSLRIHWYLNILKNEYSEFCSDTPHHII